MRKNRWDKKVAALQAAGRRMPCFSSALSGHVHAALLWPGHSASSSEFMGRVARMYCCVEVNVYRLKSEMFTVSSIEIKLWC